MNEKNIKNQKVLYHVKAIKNWNKQDNEEISFEKGDKIAILFDSESWWYGYVVNSNNPKPGFFPNIVVQKIPEKKTNTQVTKSKSTTKDNESIINFNSDDEDEIQIGVEFNENEKTSEISSPTPSETSEDLPLNMLPLSVENLRKMNELESDKKEKNKKNHKQEQNLTNSLFSNHKQKEKTRQKEKTKQKEKTRQKVKRNKKESKREREIEIVKERNKSKKKTKKIPPPKPKKKPKDFKRTIQQPNNNYYRSNKKTDKNKQQEKSYLKDLEYVAKQKKNQKQKQNQRQMQKQKPREREKQKENKKEKESQKEKEREIAGYGEIFLKSNFTWKENVTKEINKYEILPDPKKKKNQFLIKCIKGPNKERIESIHKVNDFKQLRELLTKYEPLSIPILNIGEKDTQIGQVIGYFINRISKHPILRNTREFEQFLESKTPKEWKNSIKKLPQKITRFDFFENFETKLNTNKLESNYQKSLVDFKRYLKSLEKNIKTIKNDWNDLHNKMNDLGHSYSNLAKSFDRFSGFGGVEWRDPNDIMHDTELDSLKISTSLVSLTGFMKRTSSTYNEDNSNSNSIKNKTNNKTKNKTNKDNYSSSSSSSNSANSNNNGESSKKIINSNLNTILFDISSTNESLNRFSHLQSQEIAQQNIYYKVQNNKDTNKIQIEFQKLNKLQKDSNIFELSMIAESELFKRNTLKNLKNTMTNYLKHQIDLNHQFSTELRDIYNLVSSAKIESGVYYIEKNNEDN
ncbi:endoplasmic reticulum junction formation protein lunapark [Anaeramoeba flamelloides]|uniref:Endoplasmic reticulum junction formation protein lunapark n=1 Tax=Anaeramoeba flamelloides TaxID=1746091 RepID=A0ABQ8XU91_9EUKA|nr:endoplasmic reticulum junction formation protein lunapark [Anaeramoeba flamelloides]